VAILSASFFPLHGAFCRDGANSLTANHPAIRSIKIYKIEDSEIQYRLFAWETRDINKCRIMKIYFSETGKPNLIRVFKDDSGFVSSYCDYDSLYNLINYYREEMSANGRTIHQEFGDDVFWCNHKNSRCTYNKFGDVILYETFYSQEKVKVLYKFKYEYEYWDNIGEKNNDQDGR
jgi:hypothetical protein